MWATKLAVKRKAKGERRDNKQNDMCGEETQKKILSSRWELNQRPIPDTSAMLKPLSY